MPSPVVASSASSSPELWRTHPPPSSQPRWDDHALTHALVRQFSPSNNPSLPSRSESLARALSNCLSARRAWQTSDPQSFAAFIRAPQQAGGAFLPQTQEQEAERQSASSPMSTSDLKETMGSPLSSPPCVNSQSTAGTLSGDSKPHDGMPVRPQQENENAKAIYVENALRAAAMGVTASTPVKLDHEGHGQAVNLHLTGKATPSGLSAHAALGCAGSKVNKRRSRATNKVPITVLSADTTNFRAMVQKLTGIPVSPPMERNRFQLWNNGHEVSVLKPLPTRPLQSIQGLPTLDTSAYLLPDGGSNNVHPQGSGDKLLQDFPNLSFQKPLHQQSDSCFNASLVAEFGLTRTGTHINQSGFSLGANSDLKPAHPSLVGGSSNFGASLPGLWDPTDRGQECFSDQISGKEAYGFFGGANLFNLRQAANFENLITGDDHSEVNMSNRLFLPVDTWFCSDTALPKKTELTRSA